MILASILFTVFADFIITPPPLSSKLYFSDGESSSGRFYGTNPAPVCGYFFHELRPVAAAAARTFSRRPGYGLQMSFYGVKPKNPKENFRFSKVSQTGLSVLSSGGNKVNEDGESNKIY